MSHYHTYYAKRRRLKSSALYPYRDYKRDTIYERLPVYTAYDGYNAYGSRRRSSRASKAYVYGGYPSQKAVGTTLLVAALITSVASILTGGRLGYLRSLYKTMIYTANSAVTANKNITKVDFMNDKRLKASIKHYAQFEEALHKSFSTMPREVGSKQKIVTVFRDFITPLRKSSGEIGIMVDEFVRSYGDNLSELKTQKRNNALAALAAIQDKIDREMVPMFDEYLESVLMVAKYSDKLEKMRPDALREWLRDNGVSYALN